MPTLTSRIRRKLLWLPSLLLLCAVGCAGLLGVDDYQSSPEVLCELLDRCFEGESTSACRGEVDAALDNASPDVRAYWLSRFLDLSCAKQCSSARRCLDLPPLCLGGAEGCDRREDCCGFLTGKADCLPTAGAQTEQCCRPRGVACNDGSPCCDGSVCNATTGTCGGVVCLDTGAPCTDAAQCCTKNCVRDQNGVGTCGELCLVTGFECSTSEQCCEGLACEGGRCRVPACVPDGAPCDPANANCCGGNCQPITLPDGVKQVEGDVQGVCISSCFPQDSLCDPSSGVGCCEGFFCVNDSRRCGLACKRGDDYCTNDAACCDGFFCDPNSNKCKKCSDGYCKADSDCCSGVCNENPNKDLPGTCIVCKTDAPTTCNHSMSQPGDLLALKNPKDGTIAHCDNSEGLYQVDRQCVDFVCHSDPYCCCSAWDAACVNEASTCPAVCQPLQPTCSHDLAQTGPILAAQPAAGTFKHCSTSGTGLTIPQLCVEAICTADSYCCCHGWDAFCVAEYALLNSLGDPACL